MYHFHKEYRTEIGYCGFIQKYNNETDHKVTYDKYWCFLDENSKEIKDIVACSKLPAPYEPSLPCD